MTPSKLPREFKYVSLGVVIGTAAAAAAVGLLLLTSDDAARMIAPTPSIARTSPPHRDAVPRPSTTPPASPSPESAMAVQGTSALSLTPSQTPDALQSIVEAGGLIFTGPLTDAEQLQLYAASLALVQPDANASVREARAINGVGYGDPTNICGPLAIAILRDAGLIAPDSVPHDFWLLNPTVALDQRTLARVFPPDRYSHTQVATPLNRVDWRASPLLPGDFLFIWHGSGGNFDHMLVVTRVDREQRAYTVTNFGTLAGYVIAETMLYDPNDPTQGIFHLWTSVQHAVLGSTGFGGYELWRLTGP